MAMFRKKRRMELVKPGERRRKDEREQADRSMTRRVFLARGAVGLSFAALGGKLWSMQIASGDSFERVAEDNILRFERMKAARGRILDRAGRPLAENRRSWSVRIVPSRLPEGDAERERVLADLTQRLQLKQVLVLDRSLVPFGSEAAVVNAIGTKMGGVDTTTLIARLARPDAVMELLKDELSEQDARAWLEQLADIPGVRALSSLDFALAAHGAPDLPLVVKKDVERAVALEIASNVLALPGVVVDDDTLVRHYPVRQVFSHILGYVGPISQEDYEAAESASGSNPYDADDYVGLGGVEQALEKDLRGRKGGRWIRVDTAGVERLELLDRRLEPRSGVSARLTIDAEFQQLVTQALDDGIRHAASEARKIDREPPGSGVAVVMNPKTGELLAMVSLPTFDNQLFVDGISQAQYDTLIDKANFEPLLDRAVSGLYPPGSTLKPLLAAAGLQEGIAPDRKWNCKGNIRVPWTWDETQGNTYPCWEYEVGHGEVDVRHGIAHSCDVYFYNVGAPDQTAENGTRVHYYIPGDQNTHYFEGLGIEKIEHYLKEAFGFGVPTGIELAGEADGIVPNPKWLLQTLDQNWSIGDTINVSIGQGHLLCTPLQLTAGTAVIANGGKLVQPRLISELVDADGRVTRAFEPQVIRDITKPSNGQRGITAENLAIVREGMALTVTEGTAKGYITVNDVKVGAKSGTAEFGEVDETTGRYKSGHAWFSAFAPYDDPEIVVLALVVGGYEGSKFAGPIVNRILDIYFHHEGIRDAARR